MTQTTEKKSLFERLGGLDGITALSNDIVDRHLASPVIGKRFVDVDVDALRKNVIGFFSSGTGGPDLYEGREMPAAHRGMNLNERELIAAIDDLLAALDARDVDPETRNEVLGIFYSFKDDVLFQ